MSTATAMSDHDHPHDVRLRHSPKAPSMHTVPQSAESHHGKKTKASPERVKYTAADEPTNKKPKFDDDAASGSSEGATAASLSSASSSTSTTSSVSAEVGAAAKALARASFDKILSKVTIADLLALKPQRLVVTLFHNQTAGEALQVLAKEQVLSAPVVLRDSSLEDSDGGMYLGLVDVNTLVAAFVRDIPDKSTASVDEYEAYQSDFLNNTKLISITGTTRNDCTLIHRSESKSEDALTCLKKEFFPHPQKLAIHRVALFNAKGQVTNILSQSDVIRYLHGHIDELPDVVAALTVDELGFVNDGLMVGSIPHTYKAIDAFKALESYGVSALAITDEKGHLLSNWSASDLRGLTADELPLLQLPVMKFLQLEDAHAASQRTKTKGVHVISVKRDCTLKQLLGIFVESKIHRVWIVDSNEKPIGVVTMTDLLHLAL